MMGIREQQQSKRSLSRQGLSSVSRKLDRWQDNNLPFGLGIGPDDPIIMPDELELVMCAKCGAEYEIVNMIHRNVLKPPASASCQGESPGDPHEHLQPRP